MLAAKLLTVAGGNYVSLPWFDIVSRQTLFSGAGATDWLGRPVLADLGATWVMVYRQASTHLFHVDAVLHIRFSTDEGATWTAADTFTDATAVTGFPIKGHTGGDPGDPLLIRCTNGDILLHVGEKINDNQDGQGTWQWRSTDGGKTWSDEGRINDDDDIFAAGDFTLAGNDIYITSTSNAWSNPSAVELYKSTDHGATWSFVSEIVGTATSVNEAGICYLGGTTLLSVIRTNSGLATYQRTSIDLGATWGTLTDVTSQLGVFQRPRLRIFSDEPNRVYMFGRDKVGSVGQTTLYYSTDSGVTWSDGYHPDDNTYGDTAYGEILKRQDGTYYMITYAGPSHDSASILEYIFEAAALATWTPSTATMAGSKFPALWYKASSLILTDGAAIVSMADSSGNGRTASQGTGGSQPSYQTNELNGYPVIRFDGTADLMTIANATTMLRNVPGATILIVHKPSSVTGGRAILWLPNGVNTTRANAGINIGGGSGYGGGGRRLDADSFQQIAGGTPTTTDIVVQTVTFDYANTDLLIHINGALVASKTDFQTGGNTSDTSAGVSAELGRDAATAYYAGDIAELIVYASALSTADREQVEEYLDTKYGIVVT